MELSSSEVKNFMILHFFLYFRKQPTPPYPAPPPPPQKKKNPYISGNRSFLYFRKRKPPKKSVIFQEELPKPQKTKFLIFPQKRLRINFSKHTLG